MGTGVIINNRTAKLVLGYIFRNAKLLEMLQELKAGMTFVAPWRIMADDQTRGLSFPDLTILHEFQTLKSRFILGQFVC